ncbi:MAG TPA: hypothetical protein VGD95_06980 [Micavibrio sp.]
MSLKSLFKDVSNYARYAADIIAVVPSAPVKNLLTEKGWQFELSAESTALLDAPITSHAMGCYIPPEIVKSSAGVNIYRDGSRDDIKRYQADKKSAARMTYGL